MVVLFKIALLALLLCFTLTLIDAVVLSLHRYVVAVAAVSLLVGIVFASLGLALLILTYPL